MTRLLACRFCRHIYPEGETEGTCPDCGVRLEHLEKLPPSLDVLNDEAFFTERLLPDDRPLPAAYFGRGRGALGLIAVVGLLAFFLPWIEMHLPAEESWSGFELARHRLGWLWGGSVAWLVSLPLVLSRRTIAQMRGVRVILSVFCAMTPAEVSVLVALPPRPSHLIVLDFNWGIGLYLSALLGVLGLAFAIRFGGRSENPGALPDGGIDTWKGETSRGRTLH